MSGFEDAEKREGEGGKEKKDGIRWEMRSL